MSKEGLLQFSKRQWRCKVGHLGLVMKREKSCEHWRHRIKIGDCVFGNQEIEPNVSISLGSWAAGDVFHWGRKYVNEFSGKDKFILNMLSLRYLWSVWVAVSHRQWLVGAEDLYLRIINIHAIHIVYVWRLTCSGKEKWGPGIHILQAWMSKGRMKEKEASKADSSQRVKSSPVRVARWGRVV